LGERKTVVLIRSDIFAHQIFDFQGVNYLALNTQRLIYINYHPVVQDSFLIKKQLIEIRKISNVRFMSHIFVILRLYSQSIENTFSKYFKIKSKKFFSSLREFGIGGSTFDHYTLPSFPVISDSEKKQNKLLVINHFKDIQLNNSIIAVHSRSGNYPKYKEPKRVSDKYRNTSFSEINYISKEFNTEKLSFIRIGYFEDYEHETAPNILDARKSTNFDLNLQFSLFASCSAYIGSSSGPLSFFTNQKLPCLLLSVFPIEAEYLSDPSKLFLIPKMVYNYHKLHYVSVEEQFSIEMIKIGLTYNDILIKNLNLEVRNVPYNLTRSIFKNWQRSFLEGDWNTDWVKASVAATNSLAIRVGRQNLPIIPIEYFTYLKTLT
jgi:putative glycosyltransferase (TIGR04372 family)